MREYWMADFLSTFRIQGPSKIPMACECYDRLPWPVVKFFKMGWLAKMAKTRLFDWPIITENGLKLGRLMQKCDKIAGVFEIYRQIPLCL